MLAPVAAVLVAGCSDPVVAFHTDASNSADSGTRPDVAATDGASRDAADASHADVQLVLDPDAACAAKVALAPVTRVPVDIVFMVDNSASMRAAVTSVNEGLGAFSTLISDRDIDYRVIMLSLRGERAVTSGGSTLYPVCIPPPLGGDDHCGDGERFFHVPMNIKSTQPLEQFLGTLGQTAGYTQDHPDVGSAPWRQLLRPNATRSIVVVTDDNSRLGADEFEHFAGGPNPMRTSVSLPPGVLDASWNGLFDHYLFHAIYGWDGHGSQSCTIGTGSQQPVYGSVYTTLVSRTMGARASICAAPTEWTRTGGIFDQIATAVTSSARIACDTAIPPVPDGAAFNPGLVNVNILGDTPTALRKVAGAGACGTAGGWYYDSEANPTRVVLCPTSCEAAQNVATGSGTTERRGIEVQFGCVTVPG